MPTARATSRHRKEVASGRYVDYEDIKAEDIDIYDIAHGLSYICRFGGHTNRFYSVAEHAILVAGLLQEKGYEPRFVRAALHHDDHEAYLGDLPTPLKNALGERYEDMRDQFDQAIAESLNINLSTLDYPAIHWADAVALRMEAALLLPSGGESHEWAPAWEKWGLHAYPTEKIGNWRPGMAPHEARTVFLDMDEKLR